MIQRERPSVKQSIKWVLAICFVITVIQIVNVLSNYSLNRFALIPRHSDGLLGILTSPLLHASVWHYLSNIVPLAVFSFLLMMHGTRRFVQVTSLAVIGTGAVVWLFAREAAHVGASGVIYAYFGYLLLAGLWQRSLKIAAISLFIGISYGGLLFGVLPSGGYISWESHLAGFVVGAFLAYFWRVDRAKL